MLFYVIFILSVVILMGNRPVNKNRKLGYGSYIGITIIILVSILRFDVGWDYPGYYETVYPSLDTYAIDRFEPFNKIICQLVSYTKWPPLLFIIYGLITYILVFSTLRKYTDNLFLATLTYLAFFYTTSLGPIRQGVALAIVKIYWCCCYCRNVSLYGICLYFDSGHILFYDISPNDFSVNYYWGWYSSYNSFVCRIFRIYILFIGGCRI